MMHTLGYHREAKTMDPINRNDPYDTVNPVELNAMTRIDPYNAMQSPPPERAQDAFYIFRVAGMVLGIVVVLSGVYFAGASFVIVRDILEEPQRLNAYLDEWYIPERDETPATEPAPNAPEPTPPAPASPAEQAPPATPTPAPTPQAAPAPTAEAPAPAPAVASTDAGAKPPPPQTKPKPLVHKNTRGASNNDSPAAEAIRLITDAFTRGGLPRLAGAVILLLLASMLIRIPFGLVKAGIELMRAMIPDRAKNAP